MGSRSVRTSRAERFGKALALLREGNLSPFDLVLEILDDCKPEYTGYRVELYKDGNGKLPRMLDSIHAVDSGRAKLWSWMKPHALEHVCGVIDKEMNLVKETDLLPGIAAITPDFIKSWTVSSTCDKAPFLTGILLRAAETSLAKEKNKIKRPDAMCDIIVRQLSYQRSNRVLGFPALFGLFLWSSGCSRQTIEALHRCGLSLCFNSVMNNIAALASQCLKLAVKVGSGPHVFCYDNIQISTSIFVEQRGSSGPAKVTSGTFGILYKVRNGRPEHMKLAPIQERFGKAKGLDFNRDIRPTDQQLRSFQFQLKVVIVRVLTTYSVKFQSYAKDPALQHVSRRPMPLGYKTEQFPIRVSTIEEATVRGNLLFHDDVFLTQLKRTAEDLCEHAIPTFNDQLTNSRIRSGQILRARDTSHWTRREVFQLGFGLFHLCLNLVWALLHVHRGSLDQTGSLAYFFALLEKTRLGGDHPDYHTLLSALTQILDGILLNAWRTESGYSDLAEFAGTEPSAEELLGLADKILCRHATPMFRVGRLDDNSPADEDDSDESDYEPAALSIATPKALSPTRPDPDKDKAHQNLRLLTRDLLYVAELVRAISDGDIGRIEDFLPQLAMMFRGSGGNNYCTEILHFLLNLKHIWTPEFADIMRDNMLVNVSGLTGHAMPIDLNIEHLIGELKVCSNRGPRTESLIPDLDRNSYRQRDLIRRGIRLGNISAAIDIIKKLKKRVSVAMKTAYQGTTHTDPKTDHLVWRIAKKVREEQLHMYEEDRPGNAKAKAVPDILAMGEAKLLSSSLKTFNWKFCAMVEGRGYDEELDSLPQMALAVDPDGDGDADDSTDDSDELTAE
ncbi:hypothetical protein EDB84DRAFT_1590667 [Lactarius hengduanensis]|nr:hypothetical protein EDB84DRAFT_1590667 [Lactarius hengduanensis]